MAVLAAEDREFGFQPSSVRKVTKRVPFSSRTRSATGFFESSFATASWKVFNDTVSKLDARKPVALLVRDENGTRFVTFRTDEG